jgi:hypothetical protein
MRGESRNGSTPEGFESRRLFTKMTIPLTEE